MTVSRSRTTSPPVPGRARRHLFHYFAFERTHGQMPELDGLRGLAIILVVLRHAIQPFWDPGQPIGPVLGVNWATFMTNGWVGVDLFFVLSGFLIAHHIMRLKARSTGPWPWRAYLARRVLRIVPAYYAIVFLAAIGAFPLYRIGSEVLGFRIAYHLLFLQDYLPANIIVVFWSLGVEEKFYLVAPLVVLGIARAPSLRLRAGCLMLLFLVGVALRVSTYLARPEIGSYQVFFPVFRSPFHMTLDPILVGVFLAFLYRARDDVAGLRSKFVADVVFWAGAAIFLILAASGGMMDTITWWDKTLQPSAIAFAFGGITYGLLFGGGPARLFRSVILFLFARLSYSLYLVHLALVPFAFSLAGAIGGEPPHFALFFPIFLLVSIAASLILHYAVEKPFLIVKDRIR